MKSILLHIDTDPGMEARLQVAMDIARACDGHITCLQAVSYELFAPGDFYGSAMASALPKIREAAENFRAQVESDLANEDVSWEWRYLDGVAENRLLEQSALNDIIIIGPNDIGGLGSGRPSVMAGELALKAPAPVLVVPGDHDRMDVFAPVFIAWNGSTEAAAAIRAALPLLKLSGNAILASVDEKDGKNRFEFSSSEAALYLDRHGVDVEVVDLPRGDGKISDVLADAALLRESSVMVMGAYGHSRLAEMLLGGVTRQLLSDPKLPILLSS